MIHGAIATLFALTVAYFVARHGLSYLGSIVGGGGTLLVQTFAFLFYDRWLAKRHLQLGFEYREEGKLDEAIACYSEARLLHSETRYESMIGRGEVWLAKQEFEHARRDFIDACLGQTSLAESQTRLHEVQKAEFIAGYEGDNPEEAFDEYLAERLSQIPESAL